MVYPNVKVALAYVLLRPFFDPPEKSQDLRDAEKWKLNLQRSWFPGTFSDDSQLFSSESHPHLRLEECLVNIPKMYPGDMVF
jgi:Gig2-like